MLQGQPLEHQQRHLSCSNAGSAGQGSRLLGWADGLLCYYTVLQPPRFQLTSHERYPKIHSLLITLAFAQCVCIGPYAYMRGNAKAAGPEPQFQARGAGRLPEVHGQRSSRHNRESMAPNEMVS
jgi:hypothetical protein